MKTLQEIIIAEATEHEFTVELEEKRPKSWLKTVSAFANGQGGSFYIGVNDDGEARGLADIKSVSDKISNFIKERISPLPIFNLSAHRVEDKGVIAKHPVDGGQAAIQKILELQVLLDCFVRNDDEGVLVACFCGCRKSSVAN
jgi:ATP-dependent DNA helicase RecG